MKFYLALLVTAYLRPPVHHHKHAAHDPSKEKVTKLLKVHASEDMSFEDAVKKVNPPAHVLQALTAVNVSQDHSEDLSGLDKARATLNEMYEGAETDKTLAVSSCTEDLKSMYFELAKNAGLRQGLSGEVAVSMGDKSTSAEDEMEGKNEVDSTRDSIAAVQEECKVSLESLEEQLAILVADLETGRHVLNMTNCNPATAPEVEPAAEAAELMQCGSSTGRATYQFKKAAAMQAQLKSELAKAAVQRAAKIALGVDLGEHAYADTSKRGRMGHKKSSAKKFKRLQKSEYILHHGRRMSKMALSLHWKEDPPVRNTTGPSEEALAELEALQDALAAAPMPDFGSSKPVKCTVAGSPMCPLLQDALTQMVAEVSYGRDLAAQALAVEQARCAEEHATFNGHLETWTAFVQAANTKFMFSTAWNNDVSSKLSDKVDEANVVGKTLLARQEECVKSIRESDELMCGVKTIRFELYKMSGTEVPALQDCVVSEWEDGECSAVCGGGEMTSSRFAKIQPAGGAECPLLSKVESCNMHPCPINCEVDVWSEWGACSAACGGGSSQRGRSAAIPDQFGGEKCPPLKEVLECNIEACDRPCELGDWTVWSECSKACDGGFQTRTRDVAKEAGPSGSCPGPQDCEDEIWCRLAENTCNEDPCPPSISCSQDIDIMVAVDGSGSLRRSGWDAEVDFIENMIDQLEMTPNEEGEAPVQAGLVRFSDTADEISALTMDKDALKETVRAMEWPHSTTETGKGIMKALTTFDQTGRSHAGRVILMLTDGNANDMSSALDAAKDIEQTATMVLVPIGSGVNMEVVNEMVNWGETGDSVVKVDDFDALLASVNDIIATMCSAVECSEAFPDGDPMNYRGCQTATRYGDVCQVWDDQYPKQHIYYDENFPDGGLAGGHNYCRDPDGDSTIWCVIADGASWWDYCEPRASTEITEG